MEKTLLLVDGSSYLYRAFHAMPDLRNGSGQPTGAIYGMVNMMRRILQDYPAQYIACVFDAKGKTFRDDIYADYKATRQSMPEDLSTQIPIIFKTLEAMGWPLMIKSGVEADDVIGTMAKLATAEGFQTWISTGDKDLAQLVNEQVTLVNTMNNEILNIEGVQKKFGVRPDQIIDFLMLKGDSVDNIPGVNGCGEKTAVKWLEQYDTVDNLIAHSSEIKGKIGEKLRDHIQAGLFDLSKQLITIKTDCDLTDCFTNWKGLEPREADLKTLSEIFKEYEFRTWYKETQERLSQSAQGSLFAMDAADEFKPSAVKAPEHQLYRTVNSQALLDELIQEISSASLTAVDTETVGLDNMTSRLVGISFCTEAGKAWYLPLAHHLLDTIEQLPMQETLERLKPWLESADHLKVLHHAKFDAHVLANEGITLRGIAHDTMLQEYVLDSTASVSLEKMALRYLGKTGISYEELCGKGAKQITFDQVDIKAATQYACEDTDFTLQIHQILYPMIQKGLEPIYQLEMAVSDVLFKMERNGVALDSQALKQQSQHLSVELEQLEKQAYELAGETFNLNSPKQMATIFFEKLGMPIIKKTKSGTPSTDEDTLTELARDFPLPQVILAYRSLNKLKSTYTDKLPEMVNAQTRRVHTHFAQAAVYTGRLASSNPNLQNIPIRTAEGKLVRDAFIAQSGCKIVSADYSQIELRIMAQISGDANLQAAFLSGQDIHKATASEIFGVPLDEVTADQRRAAKAINFGLIYGMSSFGLSQNLGITREAAKTYIDLYFARYPGVASYMERIKQEAVAHLYVETLFGRRLWLRELASSGAVRARAERVAINAPMQGTAADLIKKAMVAVQQWLEQSSLRTKLVLQVHDELLLEVPQEELELVKTKLPELMCSVAKFNVPLEVEVGVGDNWGQAH
ncbi:DNA polymerase I [Basilea psittacipulmonis]|uniref:DNA polymerase I n=1 Tax=Basilea psittacipulmonis DSM 24701 TaxID=1072685 RepID=A0A077DFJ2_9BURK|nr:DNA polymerase I [Basilea psittacipulmonis]AIL32936.1 DNA polymerase I [Basilea psittacipulmonis DSM 24701]